jgi:hypothetical protein
MKRFAIFLGILLLANFPTQIQGEDINADWVIGHDQFRSNENIMVNGTLSVTNESTLTLNNVSLVMNGDIIIESNCSLWLINSTIDWLQSDLHGMLVEGNLTCFNSTLSNAFQIIGEGANIMLFYCHILNCSYAGIHVNSGSLLSYDSVVEKCNIGIDGENSTLAIVETSIINNSFGGIVSFSCDVHVNNSKLINNNIGIGSYDTNLDLINSTIEGNIEGLVLQDTAAYLALNKINNNEVGLIAQDFSSSVLVIELDNNEVINNSQGGMILESVSCEITNNTIQRNYYGINTLNSKINIMNNTISDHVIDGMILDATESFVAHNTISNNSWGIRMFNSDVSYIDNIYHSNSFGAIQIYEKLFLTVYNQDGWRFGGVDIVIKTSDGENYATGVTTESGIFTIDLLESFISNNGNMTEASNYTIEIYHGEFTNSTIINMNIDNTITMRLEGTGEEGIDYTTFAIMGSLLILVLAGIAFVVMKKRKSN